MEVSGIYLESIRRLQGLSGKVGECNLQKVSIGVVHCGCEYKLLTRRVCRRMRWYFAGQVWFHMAYDISKSMCCQRSAWGVTTSRTGWIARGLRNPYHLPSSWRERGCLPERLSHTCVNLTWASTVEWSNWRLIEDHSLGVDNATSLQCLHMLPGNIIEHWKLWVVPFCLGTQFTIQAIFSTASFLSPIFALDASVSWMAYDFYIYLTLLIANSCC